MTVHLGRGQQRRRQADSNRPRCFSENLPVSGMNKSWITVNTALWESVNCRPCKSFRCRLLGSDRISAKRSQFASDAGMVMEVEHCLLMTSLGWSEILSASVFVLRARTGRAVKTLNCEVHKLEVAPRFGFKTDLCFSSLLLEFADIGQHIWLEALGCCWWPNPAVADHWCPLSRLSATKF